MGRPKAVCASDPTSAYARAVVGEKVVAGRLVKLACNRHISDLRDGHKRGLRFDTDEAAAAIEFWQLCPHLKGEKARDHELIKLEPWQCFIVGSVFGWQRKLEGRWVRRFRVAWVECGRKNGKSTLLYPAALHALAVDSEEGGEVYAVATKKDQARLVYTLARRAVVKTPDLAAIVTPYAHSLVAEDSFSKFEALGADADTLDGLNPSCVIADEVHKWRGRGLWDVIETGMGARRQPILWAITTAGEEGDQDVYGQEHNYTRQVLEGVVQDDTRFGFIACLDPDDDWCDARHWIKANPNLGISVQADEIRQQVEKAKHSPAAANAVKRLRLGIRSQDSDAWIPLQVWDRAAEPRLTWAALKGYPCFGGLDLASTCDFAALALIFPLTADLMPSEDLERPELWGYVWKLWLPSEGRSHRETKLREIAASWIAAGWVRQTEGDAIDPDVIESDVIEAANWFDLRGLAYDPFNAAQMANHLQTEGIDIAQFPQRMGAFAPATKAFEEDLLNHRTRHDGNPAMRWMANNVVVVSNGAEHKMPARKKSRNKIDGIVAAVMARGRAIAGGGAKPSYYDTNGVEVI